jgi:hypothetical protein
MFMTNTFHLALRACFTSICRVYLNHWYTLQTRFVVNNGLQLVVRPSSNHLSQFSPFMIGSLSYSFKVFYYIAICLFSFIYYLHIQLVIGVFSKLCLLLTKTFQCSFAALCAFRLHRCTSASITLSPAVNITSRDSFSIRGSNDSITAHVHTKRLNTSWFNDITFNNQMHIPLILSFIVDKCANFRILLVNYTNLADALGWCLCLGYPDTLGRLTFFQITEVSPRSHQVMPDSHTACTIHISVKP